MFSLYVLVIRLNFSDIIIANRFRIAFLTSGYFTFTTILLFIVILLPVSFSTPGKVWSTGTYYQLEDIF